MNNQAEFDQHVEYVTRDLVSFNCHELSDKQERDRIARARAREIVLWVTSKPVPWWKRILNAQPGRKAGATP